MKLIFRNKNLIRKRYENLSLILNGKTNYLQNLKNKRNNSLQLIKEKKNDIIIEDLLKINKLKRDFSCFSFNTPNYNSITPVRIHYSHDINYPFTKKEDKCLPKKNKINFEDTPIPINNNNIYEFPKGNLPIRYINNLIFNRNKILVNVGKEILSKRYSSSNKGKIGNGTNI